MMHRKQVTGEITGLARQSRTQSLLSGLTVFPIHRTLMVLVPLPSESVSTNRLASQNLPPNRGAKHAS